MGTPLAPNLADNSGNTSPEILTPLERVRRGFNAKTATALLALVVGAGSAQAQTQVATNTTRNATTPAPTSSVKGGGQLVDTQFGKLSFAEIQKHPKRTDILDGMKRGQKADFHDWEEQVAIKEGDLVAERKQVAIARLNTEKAGELEAIKRVISLIPQIVPKYEADIAKGIRLSLESKKALEVALQIGELKEWAPRIQKLLSNPQNFA